MSSGMSPGNAALVVAVFGLLAGSAVSQRARTGLAWFGVPILCAFSLKRMHSGFDLARLKDSERKEPVLVSFETVLVFCSACVVLSFLKRH